MIFVSTLSTLFWKSRKKSHSTLRAKRATFTYWVDKSSLKNAKNGRFGEFLKTWSLRSISVTRQVWLKSQLQERFYNSKARQRSSRLSCYRNILSIIQQKPRLQVDKIEVIGFVISRMLWLVANSRWSVTVEICE